MKKQHWRLVNIPGKGWWEYASELRCWKSIGYYYSHWLEPHAEESKGCWWCADNALWCDYNIYHNRPYHLSVRTLNLSAVSILNLDYWGGNNPGDCLNLTAQLMTHDSWLMRSALKSAKTAKQETTSPSKPALLSHDVMTSIRDKLLRAKPDGMDAGVRTCYNITIE